MTYFEKLEGKAMDYLDSLVNWFENWNCTWDGQSKKFFAFTGSGLTQQYPSAEVDWSWNDFNSWIDRSSIEECILIAGTYVQKAKYASGYQDDIKEEYLKEAENFIKCAERTIKDIDETIEEHLIDPFVYRTDWTERIKYYTEKYF